MDETTFEPFAFSGSIHDSSGSTQSPMWEMNVTGCSPGAGTALGLGLAEIDDRQSFAAEVERQHNRLFGHGQAANGAVTSSGADSGDTNTDADADAGGLGTAIRAHANLNPADAVRTPEGMLVPLSRSALRQLSTSSSSAGLSCASSYNSSTAPTSSAVSEADDSDFDCSAIGSGSGPGTGGLDDYFSSHFAAMRPSESSDTLASVPDLVVSEEPSSQSQTQQPQPQPQQFQQRIHAYTQLPRGTMGRSEAFRLSDFLADVDQQSEAFESELDRAVDSAQALTLSPGSYNAPNRPAMFSGAGSIFAPLAAASSASISEEQQQQQGSSAASNSSPDTSPGSPHTPAHASTFAAAQAMRSTRSGTIGRHTMQHSVVQIQVPCQDLTVPSAAESGRDEQEATLRGKRAHQGTITGRHHISDALFRDISPQLDLDGSFMATTDESRAGLGLFGLHGAPGSAALSRTSSFAGGAYEPQQQQLSCNMADIAPLPLADAESEQHSHGKLGPAAQLGFIRRSLASSPSPPPTSRSSRGMSFSSNRRVAAPLPIRVDLCNSAYDSDSGMTLSSALSSPISLVEQAISAADARRGASGRSARSKADEGQALLSCSLPTSHFVVPSSPTFGDGLYPPERPNSSLGPIRRSSSYAAQGASPYIRKADLLQSPKSPYGHGPSSASHPNLAGLSLSRSSSLAPASPALSARSSFSGASSASNSSTPAHLAQFADPVTGIITKRSRGRRVPNNPEEIENLGKSGKIYTCKVPGCGKCFKRSEHLKRHVRSIHTDDKRESVACLA